MPYESSVWSSIQDERCDGEKDKRPIVCYTNGEPSDAVKDASQALPYLLVDGSVQTVVT